ncbi:hypothetical protein ACHAW5_000123 [Stephanodiscus triporus]|uniref:Uncharacterized protein n=1 Tax=Stephanodiscus triporus TaxID=2934178 RepID=A0ABD3MND8_9STRA
MIRESDRSINSQIHETCQLYDIDDRLKITRNKTKTDADSIASEESGKDDVTLQDRVDSQLYIVRETKSGRQLWKCPLKESDDVANHISAVSKLCYRMGCHSFRSMLPPLDGRPPIRSPSWLRHCSRGALQSYLENRLSSNSNHVYRIRFPEHVYCWFADDGNDRTADEDRWAFYHGLKIESSTPEYWLAQCLLDDMQGEDFASFLANSIDIIHKQTGKSWGQLFGEVSSCDKARGIRSKSQLMDGICQGCQGDCQLDDHNAFDQICTANNIWIPVEIAQVIAHQLFHSDWITSSKYVEELSIKVTETAMDIESSSLFEAKEVVSPHEPVVAVKASIDSFAFLQLIMKTHLSRRKKQVTLIGLMFETASHGVLTDFYGANKINHPGYKDNLIGVPQLYAILNTIWKLTLEEVTLVFREAYDALYPPSQWNKPAPDGINFQSFLVAADRLALFSRWTFNV